MKKHLYRYVGVACLLLALGVPSCNKEECAGGGLPEGKGAVTLRVTLPDAVVAAPPTRAGATDFDRISHLSVVVADGPSDGDALVRVYDFDATVPVAGDPSLTLDSDNKGLEVHFSEQLTADDALGSKTFFLVANYGPALRAAFEAGQLPDVGALRALRQGSSATPGVPLGCMMFAQAVDNRGAHIHDDGTVGRTLDADLERTVAMVTVVIDGSGLNRNISVAPTEIGLHRVPVDCPIGAPNLDVPAGDDGRIAAWGEFKETVSLGWPAVVGTATQSGGFAAWRDRPTAAGAHYVNPADPDSKEGIDYTDPDVAPLFMFENLHTGGSDFGEAIGRDEQAYKRPAGTSDTPEAIDRATQNCSYLEVSANYMRVDDNGNPVISGKVKFRLFLGADEFRNFDVQRNHYYKVTLRLSGNAVTEGGQLDADGNLLPERGDVTWRVDTELSTASFITGDVNLNGSAEFFYVEVAADEGVTWSISQTGNFGVPFVYAYGRLNYLPNSEPEWYPIMDDIVLTDDQVSSGKILLYCLQWVDPTYTFNQTVRTVTLTLTPKGGTPSSITVAQYAPVRIKLTEEHYPRIEEVFGTKTLDLLVDRVDREARPWGFSGEQLDENHLDGFDNTFHLVDQNGGHQHYLRARSYLPWGMATRVGSEIVEDGGSAMIYALMLYNNQGHNQAPRQSPDEYWSNTTEFPVIDRNPDTYEKTHFYWTIPSIEGWQAIEKARDQLDPNYPIYEWFRYWTSDAVTSEVDGSGTQQAFTYQFDRGLDTIKLGMHYPLDQRRDRNQRTRFRLVSVTPENLPD